MPGFNVWFIGGGIQSGTGNYKHSNYSLIPNNKNDNKEMPLRAIARDFASNTGAVVIPINLKDDRYFHLDCCFLPLEKDKSGKPWAVIYEGTEYMPTMDKTSLDIIKKLYGDDHLIRITRHEAENFATNCIIVENAKKENCIFAPKNSFSLKTKSKLISLGYKLVEVEYDALHEGEGSIRCTSQEIPKSLVPTVMRASDDSRVESIKKSLDSSGMEIVYDKKAKDFVIRSNPKLHSKKVENVIKENKKKHPKKSWVKKILKFYSFDKGNIKD